MASKPPDFDDLTAFPIMVSDGSTAVLGAPTAAPAGPPGDLGATASSAIKNALGWTWRPGADPKGLISALNTSFIAIPRQGRVDYQYQQRNYALSIQADMGMITGAQKSIYTRAKAILDQMLNLLAGLTPLLPDPDVNETEALRSLVRTEISDVVAQFGAEGGPNVQLVDKNFTFLGGATWSASTTKPQSYGRIGGHLGALRDAFGLDETWVNTIAEEQNLTNFIIVVDYVNELFSSWRTNRSSFEVGATRKTFMGTQLIQVSRALAVVAEALDELCYVMDTVFIQKAERQTLKITYNDGPPIFFGDLLEWIRNFVTSEGRQIIDDSGKEGVQTFTATAQRLEDLVQGALKNAKDTTAQVPAGFRTRRVTDALDNLAKQLGGAISEAKSIKRYQPPEIEWYELSGAGERLRLTVYGRNFSDRATIMLGPTKAGRAAVPDIEKYGVEGETFVSGASTASAIFDAKKWKDELRDGVSKLKKKIGDPPGADYPVYLVVRNSDDQTDFKQLSRDDKKRLGP